MAAALPAGFAPLGAKAADNPRVGGWCGTVDGAGGYLAHLKLGVRFAQWAFRRQGRMVTAYRSK